MAHRHDDHDHPHHGDHEPAHDSHGHGHRHVHISADAGDRRILVAIAINFGLTFVEIVGGILGGSLALVADGIHNLSDAAALVLAYVARKIARRPSHDGMTFGYIRAEVIAALINYTTLIVIALYLLYEGVIRLFEPHAIDGWLIVIISGVALVIDTATAILTYRMSKDSANIRAAFLHNVADALGSVGVIVAGTLIILFDWWIADAIVTLAIAAYILWHVAHEVGGVIRILMLGTPPGIEPAKVIASLSEIEGVIGVHHLHLWQMDEKRNSLEAHLVIADIAKPRSEMIKREAKARLARLFAVDHATLELECESEDCADDATIGHAEPRTEMGHAG